MKRNLFVRKVECWNCHEKKFHMIIMTKYNGLLCKKCYQEKYKDMKQVFFDFIGSFEVEYDTNFEEETKTLHDVIEMIYGYYEGCHYHLENEEPKEQYKDVVRRVKELYLEMKKFDPTQSEEKANESN